MSTTNGHPGLPFAGMNNGIRQRGQGFPPPSSKPGLPQHASSYQHYAQPQPQQNAYSQIYPPPSQSPVHNGVQNGARPQQQQQQQQQQPPPPPQQPQAQLPVPGSRSRASNHRQMPPQPTNSPLSYLPTTMGQQNMTQQAMNSQPINQQSMTTQPMSTQSMTQQAISQQAINHQQSMAQENAMMSQQTTPSHPHSVLTPQPAAQSQLQPPPQAQQPQTVQNEQSVESQDHTQDDAIEMDSSGESMDGEESVLDPRNADNGTPFVPRTPMGPMMSAPPQGGSYPTLDAVHKAVLEYCTSVGYAIVIGRSKKTVPGLKKVLFVCDRAGKPPKRVSPEMRKRKTSSRKCNCPFGFFAIEQRTQWTVRYRPDAQHLTHNHGPSESPSKHPAARKLDSKMVAAVKSLKESGVGVSQTLEILQAEHPHVPLLPRDIYNARAAINRNPNKVDAALAEDRPAIYSRPRPSAEERIIADLRKEIAKVNEDIVRAKEEYQKKVEELEEKVREQDTAIKKYEMFVDLCNASVIRQREKLEGLSDGNNPGASS